MAPAVVQRSRKQRHGADDLAMIRRCNDSCNTIDLVTTNAKRVDRILYRAGTGWVLQRAARFDHFPLTRHGMVNVWLADYNQVRPHSSLQYLTPKDSSNL